MSRERQMDAGRHKAVWGARVRLGAAIVVLAAAAGCGDMTRQGTASSYLMITSLTGGSANGSTVQSDVLTTVNGTPTVTDDVGNASLQLALKDPGGTASPNTPSANNAITVTQYSVEYSRTDGHNVQGVDVPYSFSSGVTATITGTTTVSFTLVRNSAKLEAPLLALRSNNIPLTTVAKVTFYGHDQTGREVSVSGNIEVTFANFAG